VSGVWRVTEVARYFAKQKNLGRSGIGVVCQALGESPRTGPSPALIK
jgi:hypothetical protein